MLPPPITTPISTPMRATCAISPTIASIVLRLMPNASSPIRASPESFSRIRLYLGAKIFFFLVEIFFFCDAFADDEESIAAHFGFLRGQHLLDGLFVILDERLTHQGDL